MLRYEGVIGTGFGWADYGIGDLEIISINTGIYLYTSSGTLGGVGVYELTAEGLAQTYDHQVFSGSLSSRVGRSLSPITINGDLFLGLSVDAASGLVSYGISGTGEIGSALESTGLAFDTAITGAVSLSSGFLAVAHEDGHLATYAVQSDDTLTSADNLSVAVMDMVTLTQEGQDYIVTLEEGAGQVGLYSVDASTGGLFEVDVMMQDDGLGIGAPTALEQVSAFGQTWVIIAGSQSNSLSVLRVDVTTGALVPVDHILDSLDTRFGAVQDIAVVTIGDHVFIVAGGGDDGLSLFTLAPDGRLIYLDSFADDLQTGLQNVEALAAAILGDELQIFAASQEDPGLTQMSVSLADLGEVLIGDGTLNGTNGDDMLMGGTEASVLLGGAGNDILIAGSGATAMTGGLGADVFVMTEGSDVTSIADFEPGVDRLDLMDYTFLRNLGQLTVTPTSYGAEITYQDEVIQVHSLSGGPLGSYDIFGLEMTGPDRVFFGEDTSGGDGGGSGGGSTGGGFETVLTFTAGTANAGLEHAQLTFTPLAGSAQLVSADDRGLFDLPLADGASGTVEITRPHLSGDPRITAVDVLEILRIAVGLDPTFGPAQPEHFIASDFNQDGQVNALDVLEALRYAVGLPTPSTPEWVYVDPTSDLSGISQFSVEYDTVLDVTNDGGVLEFEATAILLGNIEAL